MIHYAIIEDEAEDLKHLKSLLKLDKRFSEIGAFNTIEAFKHCIKTNEVQLVFADIKIGKDNILSIWEQLPYSPELIIISAYPEYALNGYEHEALHYLTKPIQSEQLYTALERAFRKIQLNSQNNDLNFFFLQSGKNKYHKIAFSELIYIEANGEYLNLHLTEQRSISVFKRLKSLVNELPSTLFKQIHRSYIVNIDFIEAIEASDIALKEGTKIPVGRIYKPVINDIILKHTTTVQKTSF